MGLMSKSNINYNLLDRRHSRRKSRQSIKGIRSIKLQARRRARFESKAELMSEVRNHHLDVMKDLQEDAELQKRLDTLDELFKTPFVYDLMDQWTDDFYDEEPIEDYDFRAIDYRDDDWLNQQYG